MGKVFSISMPGKVIAGNGVVEQIASIVKEHLGVKNILLVTDQGIMAAGLLKKPLQFLEPVCDSIHIIDTVPAEPEVLQVEELFESIKGMNFSIVIAVGGGSVLDSAKLLAVMLTDNPSLDDMIEGSLVHNRGLVTVMVPTTSGTGSEATPNAIVSVPSEKRKIGIVSELMVPDYVILDPGMTVTLPAKITAATGIDAMCHSIECFFSNKANPFSDMLALRSLKLIFISLKKAFHDPSNMEARENMLLASFYGGMCISTSGTTAVHALSYPLGGIYHIPHGVSNAILLAPVLRFNKDWIIDDLNEVAKLLSSNFSGLSKEQIADFVIQQIEELINDVNIPTKLDQLGVESPDIDELVESAAKVTRLLNNNPRELSKKDIRGIYESII